MQAAGAGDDYVWDVFVSYPQRARISRWVTRVLAPQVAEELEVVGLGRTPRVFVDKGIPEGADWPDALAEAHARSRVVLAVLSHPFFESGWCLSEWRTAIERERLCTPTATVVVPVRFNNLDEETIKALPPWLSPQVGARKWKDLGDFNVIDSRSADRGLDRMFRKTIEDFCLNILKPAILAAPPWSPDWPRMPTEPLRGTSPTWKARLG